MTGNNDAESKKREILRLIREDSEVRAAAQRYIDYRQAWRLPGASNGLYSAGSVFGIKSQTEADLENVLARKLNLPQGEVDVYSEAAEWSRSRILAQGTGIAIGGPAFSAHGWIAGGLGAAGGMVGTHLVAQSVNSATGKIAGSSSSAYTSDIRIEDVEISKALAVRVSPSSTQR